MSSAVLSRSAKNILGHFVPRDAAPSTNTFWKLVQNIRHNLGPSSGIDSDEAQTEYLRALMRDYKSNPKEWAQFARADMSKSYTRNTVENMNGKANLVSLNLNNFKGSDAKFI
jgi:cysteine dioxygenase